MIPDLASVRDRAKSRLEYAVYGVLALGWRGASRHWRWHETRPSCWPAWRRRSCFGPHGSELRFHHRDSARLALHHLSAVLRRGRDLLRLRHGAGARASRCARSTHLENLVTERHLKNCGKLMLATGLVLAYTYVIEPFTSWYSGDKFEMYVVHNRAIGPVRMDVLGGDRAERRHPAVALVETQSHAHRSPVSDRPGSC